ncbi:hypothetical protein GCM10011490_05500 [Pseudoclavibacter endophyticus]|uniref:TetR family transcriptional regulator n=1 Tax=Pseudoclavibacter endophyticus TaxID=1778590 RepID=A0A6H9WUT0_9MICO|nr:TetR family transcriptional regulator C-terminal domain-containing protein [Pseudoclavibacter endophyticus]KAB1649950.1 TetR family transcriptional regulator [Pseudoclavibacter endophyticus]GGA58460.1 hypothetical protein GCM10011490_05500 [Pseudoclavibacter endophyticus]
MAERTTRATPSARSPGHIAESVWAVIAERGVAGVSMRSVAAQARVSTGLVQHYFSTRENLLHASMDLMVARAATQYRRVESPREALEHALSHAVPASDAARRGAAVWHAFLALSTTDARAADILARAKTNQEREVAGLLAELSGRPDSVLGARCLIALADGLAARALIADLDPAECLELIRDAIAAQLR